MPTNRVAGGMLAHALRSAAPLLAVLWLACAPDETGVLSPQSLARSGSPTIAGKVLGPDGSGICKTIGSGTMVVQLLNPEFGSTSDVPFLGAQELRCPRNNYSLPVAAGTAHLRVTLPVGPTGPTFGDLPWRHLEDVEVGDAGADHDVNIVAGTQVGGTATVDGKPIQGVFLQLAYDFNGNFGATNGLSDTLPPTGNWTEFFGRAPMILQNGVRYSTISTCSSMLGTRLVAGFPGGGFEFPTEVNALNCVLETGAATRFSHTFTRVVVTPMPGDIGGSFSPDFFDRYGVGWGVQFPISPGAPPGRDPSETHLFLGGLLIALDPDTVLAGVDVGGEMECGFTCRRLGLNGTVKFTSMGGTGRQVTWSYSGEALEVTQTSVDGRRPYDYVLFRFSIRNTSRGTRTFHAGFFGDWDIDADALEDLGFTDLGGKLMYLVSQAETGFHVGTMLLGPPISGNYFFSGAEFPSSFDQVQALSGGLRRETAGPADLRYIQGAGPFTLRRGQQRDVWIAVVAGEDKSQLLANAAAAQADVAGKANIAVQADGATSPTTMTQSAPAASGARSRSICKDCKPR
jgi:hypothetical protein